MMRLKPVTWEMSAGDENLKRHLSTASARAAYIGNTTQKQPKACCSEEITYEILNI